MAKALVIVESPAKAKTINKYLGKQYVVKASLGHIKDLPKKDLAVDVDHGFEPTLRSHRRQEEAHRRAEAGRQEAWTPSTSRPTRIAKAKRSAATCRKSWKRKKNGRPKIFRVMFNEITKKAIQKAFEKPGQVNINLVDAQQARRVLDRLVGYKISPLLWDKVRRGLSAGRVQTVALRVIVEREREIRAFSEAGILDDRCRPATPRSRPCSSARLIKAERRDARSSATRQSTDALVAQLDGADYIVKSRRPRARRSAIRSRRSSPPPCSRSPRASCASA